VHSVAGAGEDAVCARVVGQLGAGGRGHQQYVYNAKVHSLAGVEDAVCARCIKCILLQVLKMQSVLEEQASLELGAVDTNNILTLLECPVCLDHITPPIKQCIKVIVAIKKSGLC
jgi:hypothetical protein